MSDRPLTRPEHLGDAPESPRAWLARRPAGLIALALGVLSFGVVAAVQEPLWSTPDLRLSLPGFAAATIASLASVARRERAHALWLIGVGLASAALVLGWFLMVAVVIGTAALLMVILNSVM